MSNVLDMSKAKAWFNANLGWPLGTILGVSFALVYVIPLHWIRAIPGMNEFLAFVPAHVPGIKEYIAVSKMPELASVFFPVMALLAPLAAVAVWRTPVANNAWYMNFWVKPVASFFRLLLVALFAFGVARVTYWVGGYELDSFSVKDSRFYLSLQGPICAGIGFFLFFGVLTRAIYSIFSKEGF